MKYENKTTLLSRVDPAYKICYSLAVSVLTAALNDPALLFALMSVSVAVLLLARPSFFNIRPLLIVVFFVVSASVVSQAFFYSVPPGSKPLLTLVGSDTPLLGKLTGGVNIYREGIIYGLVQSMRSVTAVCAAATLILTTASAQVLNALNKLGVPRPAGFMLSTSIRFLPDFLEEGRRLLLALRLRGFRLNSLRRGIKAGGMLMFPLALNSLRMARQVSLAAEIRGFGAQNRPGRFNTMELVSAAFFIILMYVSVLPFRMGLSRLPFLQVFLFSIPFTAVLTLGIMLIPKNGMPTMLNCGYCLFSQLVSYGINPLWWISALLESAVLEGVLFFYRGRFNRLPAAIIFGCLRGLTVYSCFYFISAPFIWHRFYDAWFISVQLCLGMAGAGTGALLGYRVYRKLGPALQNTAA